MIDLVANAGIPVVWALLSVLVLATRVWHPRYVRATQVARHRGVR